MSLPRLCVRIGNKFDHVLAHVMCIFLSFRVAKLLCLQPREKSAPWDSKLAKKIPRDILANNDDDGFLHILLR